MAFDYAYSLSGSPILKDFPVSPIGGNGSGTQYNLGDACKFVDGQIAQCGATDIVQAVINGMITPPNLLRPTGNLNAVDAGGDRMQVIMVTPQHVFSSPMLGNYAPAINNAAMAAADTLAGNTTTVVKITIAELTTDSSQGSAGTNLIGGTVRNNNTGEVRRIITASYGSGQYTLTLDVPTSRVWNGNINMDSLTVVPWAAGANGVRLGATAPSLGVSNTIVGQLGGAVNIISVDLVALLVYVTFATFPAS